MESTNAASFDMSGEGQFVHPDAVVSEKNDDVGGMPSLSGGAKDGGRQDSGPREVMPPLRGGAGGSGGSRASKRQQQTQGDLLQGLQTLLAVHSSGHLMGNGSEGSSNGRLLEDLKKIVEDAEKNKGANLLEALKLSLIHI